MTAAPAAPLHLFETARIGNVRDSDFLAREALSHPVREEQP
jgi:hypothetical protein